AQPLNAIDAERRLMVRQGDNFAAREGEGHGLYLRFRALILRIASSSKRPIPPDPMNFNQRLVTSGSFAADARIFAFFSSASLNNSVSISSCSGDKAKCGGLATVYDVLVSNES